MKTINNHKINKALIDIWCELEQLENNEKTQLIKSKISELARICYNID